MKYLKVPLKFVIVALIISPFFVVSRIIKVDEIRCQSQFGPCNTNIEASLDEVEERGGSLYEVKKRLQNILADNVLVSDYSFQFKLPNTLEIDLLERKPKYAIKQKETSSFALVDSSGYVVYFQEATTLPVLIVSEAPPNVGDLVSEKNFFALELLYDLFSSYQIRTGIIENESLVIELNQVPKVIFPLEGDREVLLGSLRLILSRLNSSRQVSTIDLRFKNPIIK